MARQKHSGNLVGFQWNLQHANEDLWQTKASNDALIFTGKRYCAAERCQKIPELGSERVSYNSQKAPASCTSALCVPMTGNKLFHSLRFSGRYGVDPALRLSFTFQCFQVQTVKVSGKSRFFNRAKLKGGNTVSWNVSTLLKTQWWQKPDWSPDNFYMPCSSPILLLVSPSISN